MGSWHVSLCHGHRSQPLSWSSLAPTTMARWASSTLRSECFVLWQMYGSLMCSPGVAHGGPHQPLLIPGAIHHHCELCIPEPSISGACLK